MPKVRRDWYSPKASRTDTKVIAADGDHAGWFRGGNSSCRRHIARDHYAEYTRLCKEEGIDEQMEAIPKKIQEERVREREAAAGGKKSKHQTTLDLVVKKVKVPTSFSPDAILKHVTILIVTGDQVSRRVTVHVSSREVPD